MTTCPICKNPNDDHSLSCPTRWTRPANAGAAPQPEPGKVVAVTELPDCNFCADGTPGPYDFATRMGPWANGCERHWLEHRASPDLGVGKAQLWIIEEPPACNCNARGNVTHEMGSAGCAYAEDDTMPCGCASGSCYCDGEIAVGR